MSEGKSNETALDREVRRFKNMPIVVWIGLFAMVIGVAAHFLNDFVTLSRARKELFAEKPALVSVSYSRLFGASQVQYVLRAVAGEDQIGVTDDAQNRRQVQSLARGSDDLIGYARTGSRYEF